jgi:SAM-dependent methyltransferase
LCNGKSLLMSELRCHICGNSNENESFSAREMMYGFRDYFNYFQCSRCGCLQISEIPRDLSRYYPADYYSYHKNPEQDFFLLKISTLLRDKYAIGRKGLIGKVLNYFFPEEIIKLYSDLPSDSRILDIGCGSGKLPYRLKECGFKNVTGTDPFNGKVINYKNGLTVYNGYLSEISGKWDVITYHHSFEHIRDPLKELNLVSRLLTANGMCIIRIPTVDSYAWNYYKTDWVQLDPPRHLFLYSLKSFKLLVDKTSLHLEKTVFDSTAIQFWGSEQYKKDIALRDNRSYAISRSGSIFRRGEIKDYKKRSDELNRNKAGDQVIFYLRNV